MNNYKKGKGQQIFWRRLFTKNANWATKQQTSWVITLWWFSVSFWRICITLVWPRGFLKLAAPSNRSERHLHFVLIRLCLALLFTVSIIQLQVYEVSWSWAQPKNLLTWNSPRLGSKQNSTLNRLSFQTSFYDQVQDSLYDKTSFKRVY